MMLVTLQQARDHLRSDDSDDDNDLELKVLAASAVVMNYIQYLDESIELFTDTNGDPLTDTDGLVPDVPYAIKAATLLLIGYLYRNRDGDPDKAFSHNQLPWDVTALLAPYRDPSLA